MSKLITTREAAGRLGITPQAVRKLIKNRTLKAEKLGRDWAIPEENLEKIKDRRPGPR